MDCPHIVFEKWTYPTTQIFIEVMFDEAKKEESTNSKKTRTFNPHQWVAICEEFRKRTNTVCYSIQKLKEKFPHLKHELSVFKDLKDHSGLGQDPVKQTVTAPEPVWQEYIQGHKDAKQFKSKGLDHYDILVELCEGTLATGAFVGYPSTLDGPTAEDEREMMRQGKPIRMADQMSMDSRGKRKSDETGGSSSKSIKIDEKSQAYATFGYAQQKRVEYFKKLTADRLSIADCIKAVDEIASFFDEDQYYKAYDILAFGSPAGRQGFMGLSTDRRIGWVERIGRQS
ncbi:hypothetical protein RHSIM_Rhsim09G0057100 [Rhododendron simsii]|uniref:Myb/SANT-like domain-containing protein n=1 Tax=Rhododendron simsii TaxID=118357 RepID=A0A834GEZ2_RHOSS|nr:hypothetical protein RHSIM_Rhsim09G0057100 [Rhododendron simsii]